MLFLEERPDCGLERGARFSGVPSVGNLGRREFHLRCECKVAQIETLADLLLKDPHENVFAIGFAHAAERERHRKHLQVRQCPAYSFLSSSSPKLLHKMSSRHVIRSTNAASKCVLPAPYSAWTQNP